MSFDFGNNIPSSFSETRITESFIAVMQRVYLWMALGLLLTASVAWFVAHSMTLLSIIFGNGFVFFGLIITELILVIAIGRAIAKLSPGVGLALFFVYSALNGATLSVIFLAYQLGTISLAFMVTAVLFGIMSIVGYTTKQDLTKWGGILFMALIGLIIASIANMFLANSTLDWIITYAGILLFLALTVYDTQRIKNMTRAAIVEGENQVLGRIGVLGALRLYLDFVNLFLFILRLFGRRR